MKITKSEKPVFRTGIKIDKAVDKKLKKQRFVWWKMYSYKVFNYLMQGRIDDRSPNLSGDSIQIGYSDTFTLKTVSRYFIISYLPESTPVAFKNYLNQRLRQSNFWVQLSIKYKTNKYVIDFGASHVISKVDTWQRRLTTEQENEYTANRSDLSKVRRLLGSYLKLKDNQDHTKETLMVLKLQTRTKPDMRIASDRLRAYLKDLGVKNYTVAGNVLDFMRGISSISRRKTVTLEGSNRILMTNRDIVETLPYVQGKVGGLGPWFGMDKGNGCPVWIPLKNSPDAKNVYITSETGEGKTNIMRALVMFHNAEQDPMFIHDHKGNEFTAFTSAVNGVIISMTPSKTSFINVWKIPVDEADSYADLRALQKESASIGEMIFLTMTEPKPDELRDYKNLYSDFMRFVYDKETIAVDNPETYRNTDVLSPQYLYDLYESFSTQTPSAIEIYGKKMLTDILTSLRKYWHPKGEKSEYFRNEILLSDFLRNRVVCFDFGMAETPKFTIADNDMKLKKIFMEYSRSRFINYNKKRKKFTVNIIEEIQSADEDVLAFTAGNVTEGRAKNLINYIIGNSTGVFATKSSNALKILENITVRLIGRLKPIARDFYIEQFDLQKMENELHAIGTDENYKYHFLLDSTVGGKRITAVVTMVLTDRVTASKFFRTVDVQK